MSDKPAWLTAHGRPWTPGDERQVFETGWIRVIDQTATAPTGRPAPYGLVRFKNLAVAVLPIHEDGTVTLVGQYRFPFMAYSPLEGAKRELAEETGLAAAEWREILRCQLSNSVTDEQMVGYLATGLGPAASGHAADETEAIALARVPFREVLTAVTKGHIQDVLTVAMVLRGHHMAVEGSLPGAISRAMLG